MEIMAIFIQSYLLIFCKNGGTKAKRLIFPTVKEMWSKVRLSFYYAPVYEQAFSYAMVNNCHPRTARV